MSVQAPKNLEHIKNDATMSFAGTRVYNAHVCTCIRAAMSEHWSPATSRDDSMTYSRTAPFIETRMSSIEQDATPRHVVTTVCCSLVLSPLLQLSSAPKVLFSGEITQSQKCPPEFHQTYRKVPMNKCHVEVQCIILAAIPLHVPSHFGVHSFGY